MTEFTRGERILLVEDQADLREITRSLLESRGFVVSEASSGAEAIEAIAKAEFDLVITDVIMPGLSGPALANAMAQGRTSERACPVLFISGYAAGELEGHGVDEKTAHFLSKPFTIADLVGKIREILQK